MMDSEQPQEPAEIVSRPEAPDANASIDIDVRRQPVSTPFHAHFPS